MPIEAQRAKARKPNIVVIIVDDLGYGDLSAYGAKDIRTPNIDRLAADGMRFDNFYANSPVCSPTRAALMTGRYPDTVGVPGVIRVDPADNWGYLAPDAVLLPSLLKREGYRTAIFGKWHLGMESPNLPNDRGFDRFRGYLEGMMDDYYTHLRFGVNYMRDDRRPVAPRGHATEVFTDWALAYLDERKHEATRPFFMYLAYNAPHVPVQPPADWIERVRRREPRMEEKRLKLAALIEHLDHHIGRVVERLKAIGTYDDTLIVFTSDNGGQLNVGASSGDLRGGKEEMYEGGIRVPLIAVWRNRIKPDSRASKIALTMDLMPTLAEAAGVSPSGEIDGESLLPVMRGESAPDPERTLFFVRREGGIFYHGKDYYAVRRGRWKMVQNHPYMPFRIYDLANDPQEQTDVANQNRAIQDDLSLVLRKHIQRAGSVPWQKPEERRPTPRRTLKPRRARS